MKRFLPLLLLASILVAQAVPPAHGQCLTAPADNTHMSAYPPPGARFSSLSDAVILELPDNSGRLRAHWHLGGFSKSTTTPGSSLGGEAYHADNANLTLEIQGEGTLAGYHRLLMLLAQVDIHSGPRDPAAPSQIFLTDLILLTGELAGDSTFELLRVSAGRDLGLPSPGHTSLTRLPSGDYQVDSFFDIFYEIEFQGGSGSVLEGQSGAHRGNVTVTTCPEHPRRKAKWLQPPDRTRTGIDIRVDRTDLVQRTLADDFLCTATGPITHVRFWGSWKGDPEPRGRIQQIHLSIHEDIPAVPGKPDGYSRPGKLLWQRDFGPDEFSEAMVAYIAPEWEWWWDVCPFSDPNPQGDQRIYEYNVRINPDEAFVQEGTPDDPQVYWLDLYVLTDQGVFGWKTSSRHWNDDATYSRRPCDQEGWGELIYPQGHPYAGESIDMSFAIITTPITKPRQGCCLPDGQCADLTVAECLEKKGQPQGPGTTCLGDANGNGRDDLCEDCNGNGIPDHQDIASGTSSDCNANGIPDECEKDCNGNGVPDDCDISSGASADLNANGIPDECEPRCEIQPLDCPDTGEPAVITSILAGADDSFAMPAETAAPDPTLLNYITGCSAPLIPLQFDHIPGETGVPANSWLGHTFTGLPSGIVAARLELRVRATTGVGSGGTYNDHVSFVDTVTGCSPSFLWSSRFANLPEAGGAWLPGQTATFCLDLAALPTTSGPVSILNQLASGQLRVRVDDDSGVDFMRLVLAACPCEFRYEHVFTAGHNDRCTFRLPGEPASPSTELTIALPGPWRQFDEIVANRRFGHTFTGLPADIVAAQLEICLRAGYDIPSNDTIALEFLNPGFAWGGSIASLTALPWVPGDQQTLVLDLDNLPPSTASVTSVLGDLVDGDLDVHVQDDTAVDYVTLRVWTCCGETVPGDVNLDGKVNLADVAVLAENWLRAAPDR